MRYLVIRLPRIAADHTCSKEKYYVVLVRLAQCDPDARKPRIEYQSELVMNALQVKMMVLCLDMLLLNSSAFQTVIEQRRLLERRCAV